MISALRRWLATNRVLLGNTSSLLGTTAVTSLLGVAFYGVLPSYFSPHAIGFALTAIAAMMILSQISTLGLQTLLVGELPRQRDRAAPLIATALLVAGATGAGIGALFAALTTSLFAVLKLGELAAGLGSVAIFALGVGLTTVVFVLDAALVGLLRGNLQFGRNTILAVAKLGAVVVAGQLFRDAGSLAIYAAWAAGNVVSLLGLATFVVARGQWPRVYRPRLSLLRGLGRSALRHHALNLVQTIPNTAFPLVVTAILSATMSTYFNYSWLVASFVSLGLSALTTVLYAVGAADPAALAQKMRVTLWLSFGAVLLATLVVLVGADRIMTLLGHGDRRYADYGAWSLRIFEVGMFPLIIRTHYVAVSRVYGRMARAALVIAAGGALELVSASIGARMGGLTGFGVGWFVAVSIEALLMARTVYRATTAVDVSERRPVNEIQLSSSV